MGMGMGVGKGTGVGTRSAQKLWRMMTGWMQSRLRSDCVFFSLGNMKVNGQGTATVLSPDDFCVCRAFFTGLGKGEDPMEGGRGVLPP